MMLSSLCYKWVIVPVVLCTATYLVLEVYNMELILFEIWIKGGRGPTTYRQQHDFKCPLWPLLLTWINFNPGMDM